MTRAWQAYTAWCNTYLVGDEISDLKIELNDGVKLSKLVDVRKRLAYAPHPMVMPQSRWVSNTGSRCRRWRASACMSRAPSNRRSKSSVRALRFALLARRSSRFIVLIVQVSRTSSGHVSLGADRRLRLERSVLHMQVLKALSDDGVKLVNLGANGTASRSTIVAARSQRSPVKKKSAPIDGAFPSCSAGRCGIREREKHHGPGLVADSGITRPCSSCRRLRLPLSPCDDCAKQTGSAARAPSIRRPFLDTSAGARLQHYQIEKRLRSNSATGGSEAPTLQARRTIPAVHVGPVVSASAHLVPLISRSGCVPCASGADRTGSGDLCLPARSH